MAYKKYFTLSFDDGLEQDKEIIEILKQFGLRCATFNLNAGMMGRKAAVGRIRELGFTVSEDLSCLEKKGLLVHYSEAHRIPADEIAQVYEGFEVASHGYLHQNLKKLSLEETEISIGRDIEEIRKLTGKEIHGFAYPYGAVTDQAVEILKKNGIRYARTTATTKSFSMPEDRYHLSGTSWMIQKDVLELARKFIETGVTQEDQLFYVWGHGYEFDFGTRRSNWERLKRLCDMMAGCDDIVCCTNGEIPALGNRV